MTVRFRLTRSPCRWLQKWLWWWVTWHVEEVWCRSKSPINGLLSCEGSDLRGFLMRYTVLVSPFYLFGVINAWMRRLWFFFISNFSTRWCRGTWPMVLSKRAFACFHPHIIEWCHHNVSFFHTNLMSLTIDAARVLFVRHAMSLVSTKSIMSLHYLLSPCLTPNLREHWFITNYHGYDLITYGV